MDRSRFFHRVSITVLSLFGLATSAWGAAALHLAPGVNAGNFSITPDGSRVVFESYSAGNTTLYSARTDAVGSPLPISPAGSSPFLFNSQIAPDSSRIVFDANEFPATGWQVSTYSSRLDGSVGPINLNTSHVYDDDPSQYNIAISPNSQRAVIRADQGDYSFDLLSRPIDGGAAPILLNGSHSGNFGVGVTNDWTPAGNRVVFIIQDGTSRTQFSREFDGSGPAVQLTPAGHRLALYAISRDNSTLAMATIPGPSPAQNLYSIPVAGGAATPLLISDATHTHTFQDASLSPNGQHVIFMENYQISTIKSDGSSAPTRFDTTIDSQQTRYAISPNSAQIAFLSQPGNSAPSELFVSPIDASTPAKKLSLPLPPGGTINDVQFTPDSRHVVYIGDQLTDGAEEIFSVLPDGSAQPVRLAPAAPFAITPDGSTLITGYNSGGPIQSLMAIPIDGGPGTELVHNPFPSGGIDRWNLSNDGSMIVFTASTSNSSEIFAVAIPEPTVLWSLMSGVVLLMRRRRPA